MEEQRGVREFFFGSFVGRRLGGLRFWVGIIGEAGMLELVSDTVMKRDSLRWWG